MECIEQDNFTVFPKLKMPKMPVAIPKIQTIRLYCNCKLPDFVDNMIRCDNTVCVLKLYHKSCVNNKDNNSFICKHCSL